MSKPFTVVASAFESTVQLTVQQRRIAEGVRAAIADPYWMIGRQWQLGEFRSSSGGSPLELDVDYITTELTIQGGKPGRAELPLQALVESASPDFDLESAPTEDEDDIPLDAEVDDRYLARPPSWKTDRLEYSMTLEGPARADRPLTRVIADEYQGGALDWYEFQTEHLDEEPIKTDAADHLKARPSPVTFTGMPRARFWDFEDHEVDFGDLSRAHNFLSVMLMEFGLSYSNDWFIAQLPQACNTLRRIVQMRVRDVFDRPDAAGTEIKPHENRDDLRFQMFALESGTDADRAITSSCYHLLPDVHPAIHAGGALEEVVFFRDETANLAWGVERRARARPIAEPPAPEDGVPQTAGGTARRRYEALELPPRSYIPYQPIPGEHGQVRLRRGRTVRDPFDQQYQTRLVGETRLLCEEEIPSQPISVLQQPRLACRPAPAGEQGLSFAYYLWVGRRKGAAPKLADGRLRFDVLK